MTDLQRRVQELQSRVEENRAATDKVAELKADLQKTVAWGREMFFQIVGRPTAPKRLEDYGSFFALSALITILSQA